MCVAVFCSMLQCVAVCGSILQCVAVTAVKCCGFPRVVVSVLLHQTVLCMCVVVRGSALQCVAAVKCSGAPLVAAKASLDTPTL